MDWKKLLNYLKNNPQLINRIYKKNEQIVVNLRTTSNIPYDLYFDKERIFVTSWNAGDLTVMEYRFTPKEYAECLILWEEFKESLIDYYKNELIQDINNANLQKASKLTTIEELDDNGNND